MPSDVKTKDAPSVAVLTRLLAADVRIGSRGGRTNAGFDGQGADRRGLKPGSHYATQRKQDFYANYAANDHYMSSSMQNEWPHRMTTVYAHLAPGATSASAQSGAAADVCVAPSGPSGGVSEVARV